MFWTTLLKNQSIHSSTTTTPMRGNISDAFVRMERSRMPVPNSSGASMGRLNWLATSPICNRTECERSQQQWLQLHSISEAFVRVELERLPVPTSRGASMGRLNWLATSPICFAKSDRPQHSGVRSAFSSKHQRRAI